MDWSREGAACPAAGCGYRRRLCLEGLPEYMNGLLAVVVVRIIASAHMPAPKESRAILGVLPNHFRIALSRQDDPNL